MKAQEAIDVTRIRENMNTHLGGMFDKDKLDSMANSIIGQNVKAQFQVLALPLSPAVIFTAQDMESKIDFVGSCQIAKPFDKNTKEITATILSRNLNQLYAGTKLFHFINDDAGLTVYFFSGNYNLLGILTGPKVDKLSGTDKSIGSGGWGHDPATTKP